MGFIELSDDGAPYATPFVLGKQKRKAVAPPPDDTEADDSAAERQLRGKTNKKAGAHHEVR